MLPNFRNNLLLILAANVILVTATASTDDKSPVYNIFTITSFGYSHCMEIFGVLHLLINNGPYNATIYTNEKCEKLLLTAINAAAAKPGGHTNNKSDAYSYNIMRNNNNASATFEKESFALLDQVGSFTIEHDADFRFLKGIIAENDNAFREQFLDDAQARHLARPFDIAICDYFSAACYEFADQRKIPVITAGVQGYPTYQELQHNGLWSPYCRHHKICSFWQRFNQFWENYVILANFQVPITSIWNLMLERRRENKNLFPPLRNFYPMLDMRIAGTLAPPPAYQRSDIQLIGPVWFDLQQKNLDEKNNRELLQWLDAAADSGIPVVYVSLGTIARLNRHEIELMYSALLPPRSDWYVVWKTNKKFVEDLTKGVADERIRILDWAPQYAILRHRTVRAFVTHAGLSSVMEAASLAVPMVCIPLFGDQSYHAAQVQAIGLGLTLDKRRLTSAKLTAAIQQVLNDTQIRQTARRVAEYHATINTTRKLLNFVERVRKFDYEPTTVGDDGFGFFRYWNVDLAGVIVGARIGFVILLILVGKKIKSR